MGKKVISIFFTLVLFGSSLFLTASCLLKWNLREEKIVENIEHNDVSFLLQDRYGKEPVFIEEMRNFLECASIPSDTIDSVLNSTVTKRFIGKYTYDILQYMLYQKEKATITKEDLMTLAIDNFDIIESKMKEKNKFFTEEQKQKILSFIDEYAGEVMSFFPTANLFLQKIETNQIFLYRGVTLQNITTSLTIFLSTTNICIALTALFISAFFLVFLHFQTKKYLIYLKNTILLYLFFFITVEIVMGTILKDFLMNQWESANTFMNYLVNAVSKNLWFFILVAILFVLILTGIQRLYEVHHET